jgi:predicted ribosome quality control (RQC) complex YloA/Tae2 family protein
MEGLVINRIVRQLRALLPAQNLGWVFPDETSAALLIDPLIGKKRNLVLAYRPPAPAIFENSSQLEGQPRSPFQRALASRARGPLLAIGQLKLDRVIWLDFGAAPGFIDAPPLRLVFELTGRNANLLMLELPSEQNDQAAANAAAADHTTDPAADPDLGAGRIIMPAREVASSRNRFRQVRTGGRYNPPPPYHKLDPRLAANDPAQVAAAVAALPLERWHSLLDGLGPLLLREVALRAQVSLGEVLAPDALARALAALSAVVERPELTSASDLSQAAREASQAERLAGWRKSLRLPLEKRRDLLAKQLNDVEQASEQAIKAIGVREEADILLAFAQEIPAGSPSVMLPDLYNDGHSRTISLDPALTVAQNANQRYARARRREEVMQRLEQRAPQLQAEAEAVRAQLAALPTLGEAALQTLIEQNTSANEAAPSVGLRYRTSSGFEVLVGRNARENDTLTQRLAKSWDWWLHASGYPGSHVVLRSQQREVPFSDILEAAQIAAYHSKARGSSQVPVDYLLRKQLWKPRKAALGQVLFTGQKTVFVDGDLP